MRLFSLKKIKKRVQKTLFKFSGSKQGQYILFEYSIYFQYLLGIGSGSPVRSSGEQVLAEMLKERYQKSLEIITIFDVGANQGQFSEFMVEHLTETDFFVHAFEPSQHNWKSLEKKFGNNANMRINPCGLGREPGRATLFFDEAGSGLASLTKRDLTHFGIDFDETETITIRTVDDYCQENHIERIDLLKIDVEGHELDVLQGAQRILDGKKVGLITFEFGGCNIDTRTFFRDYYDFLTAKGYGNIYRLTPSGFLFPIKKYDEAHEQFRTMNYLAMPEIKAY